MPQIQKNVRMLNGARPLEKDPIRRKIDDASRMLGSRGRLVVRASGTEPLVRVMAEGDDRELISGDRRRTRRRHHAKPRPRGTLEMAGPAC